jgi:hypothetical protein
VSGNLGFQSPDFEQQGEPFADEEPITVRRPGHTYRRIGRISGRIAQQRTDSFDFLSAIAEATRDG